MSTVAVVPERPHGFLPVLDAAGCAAVVRGVDELASSWIRRDLFADFYTLGAASYLDAVVDIGLYKDRAGRLNPVLGPRFADLYAAVVAALSTVCGACALHDPLAYPGFHIFGHRPGGQNNAVTLSAMQSLSASIHSDRQFEPHGAVWSRFADVDLDHTLTFTLALELPARGAGLCVWGDDSMAGYGEGDAFAAWVASAFDFQALKGVETPSVVPYRTGELFYFIGLQRHVIAPSWALSAVDRRITLQGHGTRCDGVWRLYF